jgi:hypothetical protein
MTYMMTKPRSIRKQQLTKKKLSETIPCVSPCLAGIDQRVTKATFRARDHYRTICL